MVVKILRGGSFKILTPTEELQKDLVRIERIGRISYSSDKGRQIDLKSAQKFVRMIMRLGHYSLLEFGRLEVEFDNVSRGLTHQIVRHRPCSFLQESTRRVNKTEGVFIAPPGKNLKEVIDIGGRLMTPLQMINQEFAFYAALLRAGWSREDARQILPIGVATRIVVSANWREWRHIFTLRLARAAHWEIRSVLGKLVLKLQEQIPIIFDDFQVEGRDKKGIPFFSQNGIYPPD